MLHPALAHYPLLLLLLLLTTCTLIYQTLLSNLESKAIRKLGSFAPRVRNRLPFGLDIVLRSVMHTRKDSVLEFWDWVFSFTPNRSGYTAEFYIGRQRVIFTADPRNVRAVLATQMSDYGKGKSFHDDWHPFLGDSIFTTDGEAWRYSRQLIRPQFVKDRLSDLGIFEKHVGRLMSHIDGHGEEIDIADLFYRMTLDSTTDYLLGESVDSLDDPRTEFASAFAEVQRVQNTIASSGPFSPLVPKKSYVSYNHPIPALLDYGFHLIFFLMRAGLKVINAFVNPFIDRALQMDMSELNKKKSLSFLEALAATGTKDRKYLRDQVVAVLLAGRDTTAGALSFTFQALAEQSDILRKLRQEILDRLGDTEPPSYEDLKNMPYLQHCMNETLRLYPAVPINLRTSLRDTTLPTGGGSDGLQPVGVLKDTIIVYSALYMQRRADLYPPPSSQFPDVLTYSPERWENWTPKTWNYIPFNRGPRICIGRQFALTQMGYTITRILQRFERIDVRWRDGEQKIKCDVVISPAHGVKVGFWKAQAN
ncbi:cytochrome P450 52A13 [Physcia stellaris]|nr:cytochrome P450 52A13 [Physcia stellaris]